MGLTLISTRLIRVMRRANSLCRTPVPQDTEYGWRGLAGDASGGFIAALVALPYGLALARLMGLPPELGLFTSIVTAPITSLLGRNPVLIGGTASATVPFIAAAVRVQGLGGAAKVCLAASVFMMIFSFLRLGRYVAKVPHAVVSGFSCGVGAMMVILQLRTLLGLPSAPSGAAASPLLQLVQVMVERGAHPLGAVAARFHRHRRCDRCGPALAAIAGSIARCRHGCRRGLSFRLARAPARGCRAQVATVCRFHLDAQRHHRGPAAGARAGVRGFD